ncbi:MAG: F0F1 ATP synthase subunit B [Planctomycetes bacterium]|nr:F0F1 ATP synthase subunit B [Planctomycetota bacterium]MBL7008959.1 F0F1 ATP synthase subunit B [Planctomycetota bacterium]
MNLFLLVAAPSEGGLDPFAGSSSIYWTILIFALSLPVMWKVVFGPISKALLDRESQAREAASAAEAAKEETQRMKEAIQADLDLARKEAAHRVAEAKARAEVREKEILAAAKDEAERERARTRVEIERAKESALQELRAAAVSLSVDMAERVISREFSDADQRRLVDELQQEFSSN